MQLGSIHSGIYDQLYNSPVKLGRVGEESKKYEVKRI